VDAVVLALAPTLSERDEGEVGATAWRLPLESTDIEIPEIESSRRSTATSVRVARECKMLTTPGWCIPRSTGVETTP